MTRATLASATLLTILTAAASAEDLTIYSQDFALVRETFPLELKQGVNHVAHTGVTGHVEPDTVVLRDPTGRLPFQVAEQTYTGGLPTAGLLLLLFEGKTIDFLLPGHEGVPERIVPGKVIRSGYEPPGTARRPTPSSFNAGRSPEAIVEIEGKARFGTPGVPLFPTPLDPALLEPRLEWTIRADRAGRGDAELAYLSGGIAWSADYTVVAPDSGDPVEIKGWVTLDNQSGRSFPESRVTLVAAEMPRRASGAAPGQRMGGAMATASGQAQPTFLTKETPIDESHVYALGDSVALPDHTAKQVELIRAPRAATRALYVYDGVKFDTSRSQNWSPESLRQMADLGTDSTTQVWVVREIVNSTANGLGLPLPKGTVHYYRRDGQGRLTLAGETEIGHVAPGETIRVPAGSAMDLSGERHRVEYQPNQGGSRGLDETFEITVRNHGKAAAEVSIVEHLYRGRGWKILIESQPHLAKDATTIEYPVTVPPQGEKTVRYAVRYTQ